ncbi:DUF5667 domain-containing protein [Planotetraspora sp. A-T 1434]|uniref:DUF5667 domain-containing protein n=1 Tax=Planotetraspora sp. A-T 1434 TaxID=2979219 RepID=UPI0021C16D4C|nr:DUF5667 domain-containing protein [Planotetraspora sp. A-T 1434]MCT9932078.1 DUF5667 domain-containing protein [Planotetraspora sp. A-T 1434]
MGWWRPSRRLCDWWATRTTGHVTARLRTLGGSPSPEFRARLREELLRAHAAERVPAGEPPARRPEIRRRSLLVRLRPAIVFAVLLAGMYATGIRTYHSVPGDVLYPLKRTAESTLLSLATDDQERAEREMIAARLRAAETASLVGYPAPDRDRLIEQTLDDMETTTRAALSRVQHHGQINRAARSFAQQQRTMVEPLLPKLDDENRDKANKYLSYIDTFTASGH